MLFCWLMNICQSILYMEMFVGMGDAAGPEQGRQSGATVHSEATPQDHLGPQGRDQSSHSTSIRHFFQQGGSGRAA